MFNRINQVFNYLFRKPDKEDLKEVKKILSEDEYRIFLSLGEYDKVHSINVYKEVKNDCLLGKDEKYLHLALLHDCGKGKVGFLRRIKKVVFGDIVLEKHPQVGYDKLKDTDLELANLVRIHHSKDVDEKMKKFQEIDDNN